MFLDMGDIQFFNFNTEEPRKILKDNESNITKNMTDLEKKAYLLGVENAFSIMEQLLEQGEIGDNVQFYKSGKLEEFSSEEIIELVKKRNG